MMPTIEDEVLGELKGDRRLLGFSIGGFNTAQLIMKRPRMFERTAPVCPAIIDFEPYGAVGEIQQSKDTYHERTNAPSSSSTKSQTCSRISWWSRVWAPGAMGFISEHIPRKPPPLA